MIENTSAEAFKIKLDNYFANKGDFMSILKNDNLIKRDIDKIFKDTLTYINYVGVNETDKIKKFIKAK